MRYLIDSDWLIDAMGGIRHATLTLDTLAGGKPAISIISNGELYDGAASAADPDLEIARIREFVSTFAVLVLDDTTMEIFARIRTNLRRRGQMISDFDILIASTALQYDLTLLTRNTRHFARIPESQALSPALMPGFHPGPSQRSNQPRTRLRRSISCWRSLKMWPSRG